MVTKLAIMAVDKKLYWKEMADYDLETAEAMFTTGRWLYVGFYVSSGDRKDIEIILVRHTANRPALHS